MQQFTLIVHIDNKRLFEAAAGTTQLDDGERLHLHTCEVCQGVFYVFVSQQVTNPPASKQNPPAA